MRPSLRRHNGPSLNPLGPIALLASMEFTVSWDFMTMPPLGAILIPELHIGPAQFGIMVSGYAFAAGISGLLIAGFADRFERGKFLTTLSLGFLVGTLLSGTARGFWSLLIGRTISGTFAGVIGSVIFATIADRFDYRQRGRAMGIMQTAASAGSVVGIPFGLYLATIIGWYAPFLAISAGCAVSIVSGAFGGTLRAPVYAQSPPQSPILHFLGTFSKGKNLIGFATTMLLVTGGSILQPYSSSFIVYNLGVSSKSLPLIYIPTGICALMMGPIIGRISDIFGNYVVFSVGSLITIVMVLIYTHLSITPLTWVMLLNCALVVGIIARVVAGSALISAVAALEHRGAYFAINTSVQQITSGVAALCGGVLLRRTPSGKLLNFDLLGYVLVASTLMAIGAMYCINRVVALNNGNSDGGGRCANG